MLAGGSGKSLLAKTFAEKMAKLGYKTAFWDCDHQRTASERYDNYDVEGTTLNIFLGKEVTYVPVSENLWLVPAHSGLGSLVAELRARGTQNVYSLMNDWMEKHQEEVLSFDYIVIDTHPDEETITRNALYVSHLQVGVVDPDDKSLRGVIKSTVTLERLKEETVQTVKIKGVKYQESPVTCELAFVATNIVKSKNNRGWTPLSKRLIETTQSDSRYLGIIPSHEFLKQSISDIDEAHPKTPIWELLKDEKKLSWNDLKFKRELEKVMFSIKAKLDQVGEL